MVKKVMLPLSKSVKSNSCDSCWIAPAVSLGNIVVTVSVVTGVVCVLGLSSVADWVVSIKIIKRTCKNVK